MSSTFSNCRHVFRLFFRHKCDKTKDGRIRLVRNSNSMMEASMRNQRINMVTHVSEKALFRAVGVGVGVGGGITYLTGVDLKNPYQSNPIIDSSRQEVQRSRGSKKERVCEYRTICPSPRAPQIAQLADETWTLPTLISSSDPAKRNTCR